MELSVATQKLATHYSPYLKDFTFGFYPVLANKISQPKAQELDYSAARIWEK